PLAAVVTFQFPARGSLPPVKLSWYEGMQPPRPLDLEDGASLPAEGGAIFHGMKGTLVTGVTGMDLPKLMPAATRKEMKPPRARCRGFRALTSSTGFEPARREPER